MTTILFNQQKPLSAGSEGSGEIKSNEIEDGDSVPSNSQRSSEPDSVKLSGEFCSLCLPSGSTAVPSSTVYLGWAVYIYASFTTS